MEKMDERAQGSIEYLLILATILIVLASVIFMMQNISGDLGHTVENSIESIRDGVIDILTAG